MAIEEEPEAGIPEWVVTFGDMMSLLLTFFIMLVSMSEIKKDENFAALMESMRRQFGHELSITSLSPGKHTPRTAALAELASLGRAKRADLMKGGDTVKAPEGEHPRVRIIRPGSQVNTGTVVGFAEFDAVLSEQAKADLQLEAGEMAGKPQKIEVRGHTTRRPTPPDSPYRDNWDLAYARAAAVKEYLISLGIDSQRIRVGVAADQEPIYQGTDPERLLNNARVEVFLLDELTPTMPQGTGADGNPAPVEAVEEPSAAAGDL